MTEQDQDIELQREFNNMAKKLSEESKPLDSEFSKLIDEHF